MSNKDETIALQAQTISNLTIALLDAQKDRDYASHEAVEAKKNYENLLKTSIEDKAKVKELERKLADMERKDDVAKVEGVLKRIGATPYGGDSKNFAISVTNPTDRNSYFAL